MASLEGAFDLHVHAGPSVARRKYSALGALRLAEAAGMGGILLLDHSFCTSGIAGMANEIAEETGVRARAYGCVMLNDAVGGLNPAAVEAAIGFGTRVVSMPTYLAQHHIDVYGIDPNLFPYAWKEAAKGVRIVDYDGKLLTVVQEILEIAASKGVCIATGHVSVPESAALVKGCRERKVSSVLLVSVTTDIIDMPIEIQKELAVGNVFVEHDYLALTSYAHRSTSAEHVARAIREVGPENSVLATDSGQPVNPDLVAAMNDFVGRLLALGIKESEVDVMIKRNPRIVLGLDA